MSAVDARTSRSSWARLPALPEPADAGESARPARTASPATAGATTFARVRSRPDMAPLLLARRTPVGRSSAAQREPGAVAFAVGVPDSSRRDCDGLTLFRRYDGHPAPRRRVVGGGDEGRVLAAGPGHLDDGRRDRTGGRPRPERAGDADDAVPGRPAVVVGVEVDARRV